MMTKEKFIEAMIEKMKSNDEFKFYMLNLSVNSFPIHKYNLSFMIAENATELQELIKFFDKNPPNNKLFLSIIERYKQENKDFYLDKVNTHKFNIDDLKYLLNDVPKYKLTEPQRKFILMYYHNVSPNTMLTCPLFKNAELKNITSYISEIHTMFLNKDYKKTVIEKYHNIIDRIEELRKEGDVFSEIKEKLPALNSYILKEHILNYVLKYRNWNSSKRTRYWNTIYFNQKFDNYDYIPEEPLFLRYFMGEIDKYNLCLHTALIPEILEKVLPCFEEDKDFQNKLKELKEKKEVTLDNFKVDVNKLTDLEKEAYAVLTIMKSMHESKQFNLSFFAKKMHISKNTARNLLDSMIDGKLLGVVFDGRNTKRIKSFILPELITSSLK